MMNNMKRVFVTVNRFSFKVTAVFEGLGEFGGEEGEILYDGKQVGVATNYGDGRGYQIKFFDETYKKLWFAAASGFWKKFCSIDFFRLGNISTEECHEIMKRKRDLPKAEPVSPWEMSDIFVNELGRLGRYSKEMSRETRKGNGKFVVYDCYGWYGMCGIDECAAFPETLTEKEVLQKARKRVRDRRQTDPTAYIRYEFIKPEDFSITV